METVERAISHVGALLDPLFPEPFNAVDFSARAEAHVQRYDIAEKYRVTNNGQIKIGAPAQIVVNNCATLNDNFFLKSPNAEKYFSVRDSELRDECVRRGYVEIRLDHFMDFTSLPPVVASLPPDEPEPMDPMAAFVPGNALNPLYPPFNGGTLPKLFKVDRDEKFAVVIVRAWEERFICDGRVYSPVKYWNPDEVKELGCREPITRWAKAYVAVMIIITEGDAGAGAGVRTPRTELSEIQKTAADLNKLATKKGLDEYSSWFQKAQAIALNCNVQI
jgi:hypothetical protein